MGQCVQGQMPAADKNFSQIKKIAAALATLCASWQGVQRATPRLNREVTVAEQTEGYLLVWGFRLSSVISVLGSFQH